MANEVVKKENRSFMTGLVKMQNSFVNMVVDAGNNINIQYDEYQRTCIMNMLGKMNELLTNEGIDINTMDKSKITNILQTVAMLKLNASAMPRECYVILRNTKIGDKWRKEFELGVEGDGNDKILRTYGIDIDKVGTPWLVREDDEFTYSQFKGFEVIPPTWIPKGHGKVVRVVYPIRKKDGTEEYHIAERADVVRNLQAHISNNLMKNKVVKDEAEKSRLNELAASLDLESILANKELLPHISPSWKNASSREAMIIRKMRNNAIKKIPKDFENAFAATAYEKTYEDYEQYHDDRINKEEAVDIEVNESVASVGLDTSLIAPKEAVIEEKVEMASPTQTIKKPSVETTEMMKAPY